MRFPLNVKICFCANMRCLQEGLRRVLTTRNKVWTTLSYLMIIEDERITPISRKDNSTFGCKEYSSSIGRCWLFVFWKNQIGSIGWITYNYNFMLKESLFRMLYQSVWTCECGNSCNVTTNVIVITIVIIVHVVVGSQVCVFIYLFFCLLKSTVSLIPGKPYFTRASMTVPKFGRETGLFSQHLNV